MIRWFLVGLACLALASPALGQSVISPSGVQQSGVVAANNCAQWAANNKISDTGAPCGAAAGTVTTTGSPASGNLTKFSGASMVTNGDLSGDATTSGALAVTVSSYNGGTAFGTAAAVNTGTSGHTLPFLDGNVTFSAAGAASTPGVKITGAPYTAGTASTNYPQTYLDAGAAEPTTFSTAGTVFGINAPSGFTGNFIDLYVNGGASQFKVTNTGAMTTGAITAGGKVQATAGGGLALGTNALFTSSAVGQTQAGAADVNGSPVAQVWSEQSAITGSNLSGSATWTFQGSRGTGSGTGADIVFHTAGTGAGAAVQNSYLTALTIKQGAAAVPGNTQVFGDADFSGTTTVTGVANHLFVGGLSAASPTLGATAEGAEFVNAANGLTVMGNGSTNDFTILNHSQAIACSVTQGTQTLACQGLTVLGTSYQSSAAPWHFTNASYVTDFTFGASMARLVNLTSTHALWSGTAPTIGTCGGSASIDTNNGTAVFSVTVGSSPGSTCTVNMPSGIANAEWVCDAVDNTTISTTVFMQRVVSTSTTLITITNYSTSAVAANFVASDKIKVKCSAQ